MEVRNAALDTLTDVESAHTDVPFKTVRLRFDPCPASVATIKATLDDMGGSVAKVRAAECVPEQAERRWREKRATRYLFCPVLCGRCAIGLPVAGP